MKITYAHQVRPDVSRLPFELREVEVNVKVWPPDDIDPNGAYQIILNGKPISDAEEHLKDAIGLAEYNLMDASRKDYHAARVSM